MTIIKQSPPQSFFMLTPNVRDSLLKANLTAAEWRIWCYLVSLDPFGDRGAKYSPAELMLKCGVKRSTYFAAKAKFEDLGLFHFQDGTTKVKNLQARFNQSETSTYSQQAHLIESKISDSQSEISDSQSKISDSQSKILDSQSLNPLQNDGSDFSQTIQTLQTNQTKGGEKIFSQQTALNDQSQDEGNQQEPEVKQGEESQEKNSLKTIASVVARIPRSVAQKTTKVIQAPQIPQDLIKKLEELEIPLDDRVREAIAQHHLSQAYGAVAHIENTWESINNPRGVFLYQLPRQPVEVMVTRGRVKTARDFGFTLTDIKKMYGTNWRDAAAHFGIEVPEEGTP